MANKDQEQLGPPWFTNGKNLLILALAVVALVQGYLLFHESPPPDLRPDSQKEHSQAHDATPTPAVFTAEGEKADSQTTAAKQDDAKPETPDSDASRSRAGTAASEEQEAALTAAADQPAAETHEAGAATAAADTQDAADSADTVQTPEPPDTVDVRLVAVTLEQNKRRYLLLSFDQPVGQNEVGAIPEKAPGTFNQELYGTWSWISPFTLRFDFEQPLPAGSEYYLELHPEAFLHGDYAFTGDTWITLRTRLFQVERLELREDYSHSEPGKAVIKGQIEFSYPVEPGALLEHLRLVDPLQGADAPVQLLMETTYRSTWLEFQSEPLVKKPEPRTLQLTLEPGLQDAAGELTITEKLQRPFTLQLNPDLQVLKVLPQSAMGQSTITATFSAPVDPKTAGPFLHVAPEVAWSLSGNGDDLVLSGDFEPGRQYVLNVDKGLTAADGAVLGTGYSETVQMPDLEPQARFVDPGMFLPSQGPGNLALESVNTRKAKLLVDRVYTNNIFPLLHEYSMGSFLDGTGYTYGPRHYLGDRIVEKDITLPGGRNQVRRSTMNVEGLTAGKEPGFYRVFLGLPDSWEGSQRWVLVTDLGIVAKKGEDDVLVWVNSFESLDAVDGVQVTLLSDQNQVIAKGVTDGQGIWQQKDLADSFEKHRPFMITAEKDGDFSFLLLDSFGIDQSGQNVGGERVSREGYMAYVYGERDIYRPGETLEAVALLRRTDLDTPHPMPLTLVQKDPEGKELSRKVVQSDERGVAPFDYDIPDFALTGDYRIEVLAADVVVATYRYKVEEFLPDRIKVEIAPEKAAFAPGEELQYEVMSRYFFGPPASELPVESRVTLQAAPFAPSNYDAYSFGNPEIEFESRELEAGGPDARLDSQGERSFSVPLPEGLTPPASLEAMLFARVSERGGRGVAAMQRVTVHPYPRYPGLKRLEDRGVDPGAPVSVDYVVLTPQGEKTSGASLRLDFYKDRWQTVLRSTPSGGFRYESVRDSVLVSSRRLENAAAAGSLSVTPPDYGSYRAVLVDEAGGGAAQVSFYAGGWGYSPWAIENPAQLDIVADKDEYAPGESATLQLRTPFAGKLLLTVEADGVRDSRVVELEEGANTATLEMPVREGYSPNVYVTGVLVRSADGLEPGAPARAFGATPLYVDREANKLPVRIAAPENIRPETTLKVEASAEPGAVITLAAVDEGILQLIAQETPDPFARFYAKRALGTDSYDTYSMLFPDVPSAEGTAVAGGGGVDRLRQFVRSEGLRRVTPVAFWSGPLVADEQGRVSVSLDIPEFQGALRLMAVASHGRQFGSSHALTRVRTPLVVTPTLPRFVSPGDTLLVPVTLRNDVESETPDEPFNLALAITGQAAAKVDATSLQVPRGKEALVYFEVEVGAESEALTFVFTAQGQGENASASVQVPVRPALPARTVPQSGTLETKKLELPLPDAGLSKAGLEREVHVGGLPLLRFSGGLRQLLGYPYGCLEQTVSRAFPLLYFEALAAALSPEDLDGRQPAAMVQGAVTRVLTMQLTDGGFSLWPGGDEAYPWGSIYAVHFLLDARQAGFHVPDSALDLALDAVSEQLRWKRNPERADLERMAYAHFVLAKAGRPDRGGMDYLRKHYAGQLSPQALTLLAGAYGLLGDMRTMDKVRAMPAGPEPSGRETGGNLDSPLRNTAMRLTVMLDTMPDDAVVAQLVRELTSLMEATPQRSTQENGLAYVALGRFFSRQESKKPFSGMVYLGEETLGTFSSEKPFHKGGISGAAPLRIVMDGGFEKGSVFYSVLTRGVPTQQAYTPVSQGLSLERRYLTREGTPLPAQGVPQGELVVLETRIKADDRPVDNVVLQALLPAGLEVENPRLESTERLPWAGGKGDAPEHQDLRDDRVLLFLSLPGATVAQDGARKDAWQAYYSVLRAVTPGTFALPPTQAEAMYDPGILAAGEPGRLQVLPADPDKVVRPGSMLAAQGGTAVTTATDGAGDAASRASGQHAQAAAAAE